LKESEILVCTVIDFPFGNNDIQFKIQESKDVIESGVDELDVVIDNSKLNNPDLLLGELTSWVDFCHQYQNKHGEKIVLKVIVESGQLSLNETEIVTQICIGSGVDFIKTSTGKFGVGAELEKVVVMRSVIEKEKSNLQIKASGGIRTLEQIEQFYPYVNRFGMGYKSVDSLVKNS
jgi:deoxyribose-phosphate aldolase